MKITSLFRGICICVEDTDTNVVLAVYKHRAKK
jgi:hypothetical protein